MKNENICLLKQVDYSHGSHTLCSKNTQRLRISNPFVDTVKQIQYLKNYAEVNSPYWVDEKKLDNYVLPSFTKKIVKYLEKNQ